MPEKGWFKDILTVYKYEENSLKEILFANIYILLVVIVVGLAYGVSLGKFDSTINYILEDSFSFANSRRMLEEIGFIINLLIFAIILSTMITIGLIIYNLLGLVSRFVLYFSSSEYIKYCKICKIYWQHIESRKIRYAQLYIGAFLFIIISVLIAIAKVKYQVDATDYYLSFTLIILIAEPAIYYTGYKKEVDQSGRTDILNRAYHVVRWSRLAGYDFISNIYRFGPIETIHVTVS